MINADFFMTLSVAFVRRYFDGPPEERAKYLNNVLVTVRAVTRFCLDVGPVWFPQFDRGTIFATVRDKLTEGYRELATRANLDESQAEFLMLAVDLAFDGFDLEEEPGREVVTKSLDGAPISIAGEPATTEFMAAVYEAVQDRKRVGMGLDEIRASIMDLAHDIDLSSMSEHSKETWIAMNRRLVDAILKSQFPDAGA